MALQEYGNCTGPLGFPMQDEQARELDQYLEEHTKDSSFSYKRFSRVDSFECALKGERADVSVVSDDSVDKDHEIINPAGLDWKYYDKSRVVTLAHNYKLPPIGKCLWYKRIGNQWKAKTKYAERPENYPSDSEWVPDTIFHMVASGFMPGKSIGLLPTELHVPSRDEIAKNPGLENVRAIIDKGMVFEYSVVTVGSNNNAIVEEITKGALSLSEALIKAEGSFSDIADLLAAARNKTVDPPDNKLVVKGLNVDQYASMISAKIAQRLSGMDVSQLVDDALARVFGKV